MFDAVVLRWTGAGDDLKLIDTHCFFKSKIEVVAFRKKALEEGFTMIDPETEQPLYSVRAEDIFDINIKGKEEL